MGASCVLAALALVLLLVLCRDCLVLIPVLVLVLVNVNVIVAMAGAGRAGGRRVQSPVLGQARDDLVEEAALVGGRQRAGRGTHTD